MATEPKAHFTPEEYLAFERRSEFKSEYVGGEIVAMTGASRRHNRIVLNLAVSLHTQLKERKSCEVFANDMRIRVAAAGLYTYPDIAVTCEPRFEDDELDTLLNPVLIAEVLSKSTQSYDRGDKFASYRALPSFAEYLILAQDRVHVEHSVREPDGRWVLTETDDLQSSLALPSIGCTVLLADVYDRVFPGP
jgi:Uma2 family endonuclease